MILSSLCTPNSLPLNLIGALSSNATAIKCPRPLLGDCYFDCTPCACRRIARRCCSRVGRQFARRHLCRTWPWRCRNTAVRSRSGSTTRQLGRKSRSSPASPPLSPGTNIGSPIKAFLLGGGALSALTIMLPGGGNIGSLYISFPWRTNLAWNSAVVEGNPVTTPATAAATAATTAVVADADCAFASRRRPPSWMPVSPPLIFRPLPTLPSCRTRGPVACTT
jgi:hypothetical protein